MDINKLKEIRKTLSLLTDEELKLVVGDLFVDDKDEEFDMYEYGYSKNSYQRSEILDDIDLGIELTLLSTNDVLKQVSFQDNRCFIGHRELEIVPVDKKNTVFELCIFPNLIKGKLKTLILSKWFKNVGGVKEIGSNNNWTMYKCKLNNKLYTLSINDSTGSSVLRKYNAYDIYYKDLLKNDGSRKIPHRYKSINIHVVQKTHEMYGDLGAMFGSGFDQQVEDNYELAKAIVEEYESNK